MNDIVLGTYDNAKQLVENYFPLFRQLSDNGNTLRNNPRRKDAIDMKTLMTMRANDSSFCYGVLCHSL